MSDSIFAAGITIAIFGLLFAWIPLLDWVIRVVVRSRRISQIAKLSTRSSLPGARPNDARSTEIDGVRAGITKARWQ